MSMLKALPIMVAVFVLPLRARAQDTTKAAGKVAHNIGRTIKKAGKDTKNAVSKAGKDTEHEARRTKKHVAHGAKKVGHGAHEMAGDASKTVKGAKKDTTHTPPE